PAAPRLGTRSSPHAQPRAHDGRRRDRGERAGQGLGLYGAPAGRRGHLSPAHSTGQECEKKKMPRHALNPLPIPPGVDPKKKKKKVRRVINRLFGSRASVKFRQGLRGATFGSM